MPIGCLNKPASVTVYPARPSGSTQLEAAERQKTGAGTSRVEELGDYAWYKANSDEKTQEVGGKKPNGLGLYDLSGNVWEWVEDCAHVNYNGAPGDGSAWKEEGRGNCDLRVTRGGSKGDDPGYLRVSERYGGTTNTRGNDVGFRLAQDLD